MLNPGATVPSGDWPLVYQSTRSPLRTAAPTFPRSQIPKAKVEPGIGGIA